MELDDHTKQVKTRQNVCPGYSQDLISKYSYLSKITHKIRLDGLIPYIP